MASTQRSRYPRQMSAPRSPAPVVTVRGEAQLETPPDLASLTFTVHRGGDSEDDVRSGLATASAQVRELLAGFDSAIEKSSSAGLHVGPVFGGRAQTRIQGFRGTFSTVIVVRDFDALSPIVSAVAPVNDIEIDGPLWSLRGDNPIYAQVRRAAIAEGRRRAADYAAAFAGTLVDLVEITDLEGGTSGAWTMQAEARFSVASGADQQPDFEFEPSIQTVSGQVTVRFTMTAPDLSTS